MVENHDIFNAGRLPISECFSPVDLLPEKRLWSISKSCEGKKPPPTGLAFGSTGCCDGFNRCCDEDDDVVSLDMNWLNSSSGLGS